MRKTIDRDDPDFIGHGNWGRWTVLLDGVPVQKCVEADDEAGYVIVLKCHERGYVLTPSGDEIARERLHGKVEIIDGMH